MNVHTGSPLFQPLELPCGVILNNRIVKSAMSESLGDGRGNPTDAQVRLYERWANGGVAASIIGEVQCSPNYAEKPGNLVLGPDAKQSTLKQLAERGAANDTRLWLQLGHAGAMSHPPISHPKGPSALDLSGLRCDALTHKEVLSLPAEFAQAAKLAETLGFGGIQIHAAHGFLLSQFLSPLFNKRTDEYGGSIQSRMRLLLEVLDEISSVVSPSFAIAIKLNSTDQLEGGFNESDALKVVAAVDATRVDLIDISGGTYFPGAKSASDSTGSGPYFIDFAALARDQTSKPLMVTGGFKTQAQMENAISAGYADVIGVARALVIDPEIPNKWRSGILGDPVFPRFESPLEGGITAWYTMRMSQLGEETETGGAPDLETAIREYEERDKIRASAWIDRFGRYNV